MILVQFDLIFRSFVIKHLLQIKSSLLIKKIELIDVYPLYSELYLASKDQNPGA